MKVSIIEKETGRLVEAYTLARAMGGGVIGAWYSDAWRCAVKNEVVDADQRDKYSFHIVEDT